MVRAITVISTKDKMSVKCVKGDADYPKKRCKGGSKGRCPWYSLPSFSVLDSQHRLSRIGDGYENIIDDILRLLHTHRFN